MATRRGKARTGKRLLLSACGCAASFAFHGASFRFEGPDHDPGPIEDGPCPPDEEDKGKQKLHDAAFPFAVDRGAEPGEWGDVQQEYDDGSASRQAPCVGGPDEPSQASCEFLQTEPDRQASGFAIGAAGPAFLGASSSLLLLFFGLLEGFLLTQGVLLFAQGLLFLALLLPFYRFLLFGLSSCLFALLFALGVPLGLFGVFPAGRGRPGGLGGPAGGLFLVPWVRCAGLHTACTPGTIYRSPADGGSPKRGKRLPRCVADWSRVIAHLDMDAFFASIEQLDHPGYRGRPVVVGADPQQGRGRGVVAAASYEARRFGIKSAMPIRDAYRACPDAVFVRPRGQRYREVAQGVREVLSGFADVVEPASIDEAYLDLSSVVKAGTWGDARGTGLALKRAVLEATGLTASIGIAPTKSCAKIASDMDKPDGLTVVPPDDVEGFLAPLPVERIPGVGPKTKVRLEELGVTSIGDLAERTEAWVRGEFGENGVHVWRLAHGIDPRPVEVDQGLPKSRSEEHTFRVDERDVSRINRVVRTMARELVVEMERRGLLFRVVGLKIRTSDFETMTRAATLPHPTRSLDTVLRVLARQLEEFLDSKTAYRLVGVRLAGLERDVGQRTLEEYLEEAGPGEALTRLPEWALPESGAPRPGQHRFGRDW